MDFSSALANLEQSAAKAQNQKRENSTSNRNQNQSEDQRRFQPRQRLGYDNTNCRGGGAGGGGSRGYSNNRDRDYRGRDRDYHGGGGRGHHCSNSQSHHHHGSNNSNNDRLLDGLLRFGYRLPRGAYRRPPPLEIMDTSQNERQFHICLLAITIDELPYEHIWKSWATDVRGDSNKVHVSLVCHAKYPDKVKSEFLQQRMLLQPRRAVRGNSLSEPEFLSHSPNWGSVEITRAMIDLLVQGMDIGGRTSSSSNSSKDDKDPRFSANRFLISDPHQTADLLATQNVPSVDKFIFISESCLPVVTLDECVQALFAPSSPATTTSANIGAVGETKDASKTNGDEDAKEPAEEKETNKEAETATTTGTKQVIYLDTSWVNARNFNSPNTPLNKYERDQFSNIHWVIPKRYRWKADQWMVLSRVHAASLLDIDHSSGAVKNDHPNKSFLWKSFRHINASDEMYFPTALSIAGILNDPVRRHPQYRSQLETSATTTTTTMERKDDDNNSIVAAVATPEQEDPTPWLLRRRVTYVDWSMGARNPASFSNGRKDFSKVVRSAREHKCLFARKFTPVFEIPGKDPSALDHAGEISVDEWKEELDALTLKSETKN